MIAETYVCATADGIEYGFTFKREPGADSEFDVALGVTRDESVIEPAWATFAARAERIAAAY